MFERQRYKKFGVEENGFNFKNELYNFSKLY